MPTADPQPLPFSQQVRRCFGRRAPHYERAAGLQRAIAWRLARHCRALPLPQGPCADLGAGSGLLARAIEQQRPGTALLRLDNCPELLAQGRNASPGGGPPVPDSLLWDLDQGLPEALQGAALLASSFALQWLQEPELQLQRWCRQLRPGGWLALAVPTAASFEPWRLAARRAAVPFTGLPLPEAQRLEAVAGQELELRLCRRLRFSRANRGARPFLQQIKAIGAQASQAPRLSPAQLRRLMAHWPNSEAAPLEWEVLLLLGHRP
jgi:malonyl-CoA O-methyltransferase